MRLRPTIAALFVLLILMGLGASISLAEEANPPLKEPRAALVRDLVLEAAALVEEYGEGAFDAFRLQDGKWRQGEIYVSVMTMDGWQVVNPPFPKMENVNLIDFVDLNFKPVIRWMIREASGPRGQGWTHFLWPRPGHVDPSWKTAFIKKATSPSGIDYIVGSGAYNLEMDPAFIVDQVRDAAELIQSRGEAAFEVIRDESKEFLFRDTYIFVTDESGTEIANPAFPIMEGKNLLDVQDADGKYLVREYIDVARRKGEAWVNYRWLKPGSNEPVEKDAFVKGIQLKDKFYIVGSGIYLR